MDVTNHHLPIEVYSPNKQYHCQKKADLKIKPDCCRRNNSSKTTSVNGDSPGRLNEKWYERIQPTAQPPTTDPQVKWSRNNITMTMEYFEPISSTSTPKRYSSQTDYSYAYYEPGAAMRHSNIPKMLTTDPQNGPSTRSSPKSISSLLSKPNNDRTKFDSRHTYTTRYGTQENIYEDVSTIGTRPGIDSSRQSLNAEGCSKIEFQDILHNHYRVLEELNLSVEELLLSTTTKTNMLSPRKLFKRTSKPPRTKAKHSDIVNSKNVFSPSMNDVAVAEDSGFSGSSSGASYIGSLRNYKTALTRSHRNSTDINALNNRSDCGTFQDAINAKVANDSRKVSLQMINQLKGDKGSGSSKGLKFPFWNKR